MGTYSEHEQRKLDEESGAELDRRAAKPALRYTPGPWFVSGCRSADDLLICHGDENTFAPIVAQVKQEANARLIAAAPELLELVVAFQSYLRDDSRSLRRRHACLQAAAAMLVKVGAP